MVRNSLGVLLVDNTHSVWTQPIVESLRRHLPAASIDQHPDLTSALAYLEHSHHSIELAVICQGHPDAYPPEEADALLARFPLARVIVCYGPWCNADGRRRDTWPLAVRVPHHDFPERLSRELQVLTGGLDPLPLTAGRDEIASAEIDCPTTLQETQRRFHVDSSDLAFLSMTTAQLTTLGATPATSPDIDLLLVDLDPWQPNSPERIRAIAEKWQPHRLVGLSGTTDSIPVALLPPLTLLDKVTVAARPTLLLNTPTQSQRLKLG